MHTMQRATRSARRALTVLLGATAAAAIALPLGAARADAADAAASAPTSFTKTFTVNSTADTGDAKIGDGVCRTSAGVCTLRAAIQEANHVAGTTLIAFDIASGGTKLIAPQSLLPALNNASGGITIDAFTQPGSHPNTAPLADNAVYGIELKGNGAKGLDAFTVTSANNVIRGFDMHAFKISVNLYGTSANSNTVVGNMFGLQLDGTLDPTMQLFGASSCVVMQKGASSNIIGTPALGDRNVVSGCNHIGIATYDWPTKNNVIKNNVVGLDPTGTLNRGSESHGVDINTGTQGTIIGGTGPNEHNVLSGNKQEGVEISHNKLTQHNSIVGNYIGTDLTGNNAPAYAANGQWGVHLEGEPDCGSNPCVLDAGYETVTDNVIVDSQKGGVLIDKGVHDSVVARNRIGVTLNGTHAGNRVFGVEIAAGSVRNTIGPNNEIAYNTAGVIVRPDSVEPGNPIQSVTNQNTITQNSIHDNALSGTAALGIDLAPIGQVNTSSNANANVNDAMLAPQLSGATSTTVNVNTCASCKVEVFIADRSAGQVGSGKTYLVTATANSSGFVKVTLPAAAHGNPITATATNSGGSTSEFAHNVAVP
jgi:CSLREA domain-containing protein